MEDPDAVRRFAENVRRALDGADLDAYAALLDPKVTWGAPGDPRPSCRSKDQVLEWYQRGRTAGVRAQVSKIDVHGARLVVELILRGTEDARKRGGNALRWQVLTLRDGLVADIAGFDRRDEAIAFAEA